MGLRQKTAILPARLASSGKSLSAHSIPFPCPDFPLQGRGLGFQII